MRSLREDPAAAHTGAMGIATHPLMGADLGTLRQVFRDGGGPTRLSDRALLMAAAAARWPASALEARLVDRHLPAVGAMEPPVFILGHWRSGTTHLYNVMAQHGWAYVGPLAVGLPHDFLGLGRVLRPMLERQLPETRYIDNIPVAPTSPQEDEIALAAMSPLSFYHGIHFPSAFDRLIDRGVFLDGCSDAQVAAWEERFTYFLRKIALEQGKRLLVKNPVYTARPAMLRRLFPGAQAIHIHRSPYEVFASMRNFYARLLEVMALQPVPPGLDIDATILRVYVRMMEAFDRQTVGWQAPEFVEVPYDALDARPMETLERIYGTLGLAGWGEAAPHFRAYLASVRSYRKNRFRLDRESAAKVRAACAPWIERWGYDDPAAP